MKDKRGITGDDDCNIVCPGGAPMSCPMKSCFRKFDYFSKDMKPEPVKKKKPKGGTRGWTS